MSLVALQALRNRVGFPTGGLGHSGGQLTVANTIYYVCFGLFKHPFAPAHLFVRVDTAGAGAQTASMAFMVTPAAPDKTGKSFTRVGTGTNAVNPLTATGVVGNTNAFTDVIPPYSWVWGACSINMAVTQPQVEWAVGDRGYGYAQSQAGGGPVTGAGPFTGTVGAGTSFLLAGAVSIWMGWSLD